MSRKFYPPTNSDIPMHGWRPYDEIHKERIRAHRKHDTEENGFRSMEKEEWDKFDSWLAVIGEEWGEVCRIICELKHGHITLREAKLIMRQEMIQVLAMGTAWVEAIDQDERLADA